MTRLTILVSGLCLAVSLLVSQRLVNMRMVKLQGIWQRLCWSLRVHRLKTAFPKTLEEWRRDDDEDPARRIQLATAAWLFLRPYFAARGYTLYDNSQISAVLEPRPQPALAPASVQTYPYARTIPPDYHPGISNTYEMIHNVRVLLIFVLFVWAN